MANTEPARTDFIREHLPYGDASHPLLYRVARFAVGQAMKFFYDLEIYGGNRLNTGKQMVVAPNHESAVDPAVLGAGVEQALPTMTKDEMWSDPKYKKFGVSAGFFLSLVDAFPVKRGENDRRAMDTLRRHVKRGRSVGIFGTGTRTPDLSKMTKLPASTAYSHGIDIQPLAIVKYKDESNPDSKPVIRAIASEPITPNKDNPKAKEAIELTQKLVSTLSRDRARAQGWAEFDAKYRPRTRRLFGKIKRY